MSRCPLFNGLQQAKLQRCESAAFRPRTEIISWSSQPVRRRAGTTRATEHFCSGGSHAISHDRIVECRARNAAGATPVSTHHSFSAEYDITKPIKLQGLVTKVEWMNPHTYFYINVKDESGKVTNWALEMGAPGALQKQGWTRNTLQIGDEVTVEASLAKEWKRQGERERRLQGWQEVGRRLELRRGQLTRIPAGGFR